MRFGECGKFWSRRSNSERGTAGLLYYGRDCEIRWWVTSSLIENRMAVSKLQILAITPPCGSCAVPGRHADIHHFDICSGNTDNHRFRYSQPKSHACRLRVRKKRRKLKGPRGSKAWQKSGPYFDKRGLSVWSKIAHEQFIGVWQCFKYGNISSLLKSTYRGEKGWLSTPLHPRALCYPTTSRWIACGFTDGPDHFLGDNCEVYLLPVPLA